MELTIKIGEVFVLRLPDGKAVVLYAVTIEGNRVTFHASEQQTMELTKIPPK